MKTITAALILLSATCTAQSIRTGKWVLNETVITRETDTLQIEETRGRIDTFFVEWQNDRNYKLIQPGKPVLFVKIYKVEAGSYSGIVTDGLKRKWFELYGLKNGVKNIVRIFNGNRCGCGLSRGEVVSV